jgi:hypothetical protein
MCCNVQALCRRMQENGSLGRLPLIKLKGAIDLLPP